MAITQNGSAGTQAGNSTGGSSFAYTNNATFLVVMVALGYEDDASNPSLTYNGVAPTGQINSWVSNVTTGCRVGAFYWLNPATGSNTLAFSWTQAKLYSIVASSWDGVDVAGTPLGTAASATNTDTTPTVNTTSAAGEVVLDFVSVRKRLGDSSLTDDETQQVGQASSGTGTTDVVGGCSWEAGAATVTSSWTITGTKDWSILAVPLKPSGAGPTGIVVTNYNDIQ